MYSSQLVDKGEGTLKMESLKAWPTPDVHLLSLMSHGLCAYSWLRWAGTPETAAAALNNYQALTEKISTGDKEPAGHRRCLSGERLLGCTITEIPRAAFTGWENSA